MKKKIISVVGARPNFMKVAPIDRAFHKYNNEVEHLIVHTGQHYDQKMSDAFFQDLEMPHPAYFLNVGSASHAVQTAKIMIEFEKVCLNEKPDLVIVVGDVNSTIAAALTSIKLGIKVAHVEAGLRSYDRNMPEEINRLATDAICNYCFVTEQSGYDNLISEGFDKKRIFFVGNTMIDSQKFALPLTNNSQLLEKYSLEKEKFVLITMHRPSNVDIPEQLKDLLEIFNEISKKYKVVFPIHPRTRKNINEFGFENIIKDNKNLLLIEPAGYIDFLTLMKNSNFVLTDSGGIQEETSVLGIPCLTIRTSTERPSTIKLGTNRLIQPESKQIRNAVIELMNNRPTTNTEIPLWDGKASERITEIIVNNILTD